jgi:hypothetical protein
MLPKCWLVAPVGQWCQKHMAVAVAWAGGPGRAAAHAAVCRVCRGAACEISRFGSFPQKIKVAVLTPPAL